MSKVQFSLIFGLVMLGACSSNGTHNKNITSDSTAVTNDKPVTVVALKDLIIGTWARKKKDQPDTLEIGKGYIHDKGEDTRLKYVIKGDSIILRGDSTTILTKADIVYRAKVTITNDSLKFTDSKEITTLIKVK
jgi:hypothetical protein